MQWKEQLKQLEDAKEWDEAIELMQHVIHQFPHDVNAYLSIEFLLMNLLVEEDHDETKHDYYERLAKKYFNESYAKFSDNAEFLYYAGRIACMSEWYFGIELDDAVAMLQKSIQLAPENLVYQWTYYYQGLPDQAIPSQQDIKSYATLILQQDSPIQQELKSKGSWGEYILRLMSYWAEKIINYD